MENYIDIFKSVRSQAINDLSPELLEIGIDALTKSEVLKDIPIFGIAFKGFSLYQNVTEAFFIKKLIKFLYQLKDISLADRKRFITKLQSDEEAKSAGEKLLVTLNRLNDIEKAEIIGKLFKKTILGEVDFDMFNRITHIVDNTYIGDLKSLKNNSRLAYIGDNVKSNLYLAGLLSQDISDIERHRQRLIRLGSTAEPQPTLEFRINIYGITLIDHGL